MHAEANKQNISFLEMHVISSAFFLIENHTAAKRPEYTTRTGTRSHTLSLRNPAEVMCTIQRDWLCTLLIELIHYRCSQQDNTSVHKFGSVGLSKLLLLQIWLFIDPTSDGNDKPPRFKRFTQWNSPKCLFVKSGRYWWRINQEVHETGCYPWSVF